MNGYLEITFGPMFSGKTSRLIDKMNKYIDMNGQKGDIVDTIVINHISDNRGEGLTPHTQKTVKSKVVKCEKLSDIDVNDYDYIAIDESQFFPDLFTVVNKWLKKGKYIHCSGLVADSDRQKFGQLSSLIYRADDIVQLKAFCSVCGDKIENAPFTKLIKRKQKNGQILVGSSDYYRPVCGDHY